KVAINQWLMIAAPLFTMVGDDADIELVQQDAADGILLKWNPLTFADHRQASSVELFGETRITVCLSRIPGENHTHGFGIALFDIAMSFPQQFGSVNGADLGRVGIHISGTRVECNPLLDLVLGPPIDWNVERTTRHVSTVNLEKLRFLKGR